MENNEEILKKISSGDPEAIAEAVDTVKENGDLVIAGKLLDILSQPLAPSTITIIANLLADIKDNQFKDLLIQNWNRLPKERSRRNYFGLSGNLHWTTPPI